jgi:hypothetical protein
VLDADEQFESEQPRNWNLAALARAYQLARHREYHARKCVFYQSALLLAALHASGWLHFLDPLTEFFPCTATFFGALTPSRT